MQPANTFSPMLVISLISRLNSIVFKHKQFSKTLEPMFVTVFGIITFVIFIWLRNALLPIELIIILLSILSGIITLSLSG